MDPSNKSRDQDLQDAGTPNQRQVDNDTTDGLQPPAPTARPALSDRQYSTHVYSSSRGAHIEPSDLEAGYGFGGPGSDKLPIPSEQFEHIPLESIVTIAPSRGVSHRTRSEHSTPSVSSGITLNEVSPPEPIVARIASHGPGTYRCTVTDARTPIDSSATSQTDKEGITISVESCDKFDDRIATQETLDKLLTEHPLPVLEGNQRWNQLRYRFFSVYRRLHAIVLIANLMAIFVRISQVVRHPGSCTYGDAANAVAVNLFIATTVRHEHAVNLFFRVCCSLPHWMSLSIRRHAGKVYSQGGVHSACSVSAFFWYIFFAVLLPLQWQSDSAVRTAVLILSGMMLLDLVILITMAYPAVRSNCHNQWEMSHRFGGWFAILVVWAQVALLVHQTSILENRSYGRCLISLPAFWFLVLITLMIFYPWIRLRRREIAVEKLSSHAMRLNFPSHDRRMTTCAGTRLATSPLFENHGFATIPEPNGQKGYSVIVSAAGDWTKELIKNPPKYIWTRGAPTLGVARVGLLFKPCVFVATGSGIGPTLSFLQVHPEWPCRVLWSARFPEATYGTRIMGAVLAADPDAIIIDTKKTGKPDLVGLTYSLVKEINAEAVIVISNPAGTKEVVYNMETRKIPAYGAIWDS